MLTILIPTRNRPEFLERLLRYYQSIGSPYPILIGDSSDAGKKKKVIQVVEAVQHLSIQLLDVPYNVSHSPGQGTIHCINDLLEKVTTPYSVFNADDDILILPTLKKCISFLESRPDYSLVHGESIQFTTSNDQPFGEVTATSRYCVGDLVDALPDQRLLNYFGFGFVTEFSVKRTASMRRHWQQIQQLGLDNRFGELLVSSLAVIEGKFKKMDDLYMLRQVHAQAVGQSSPQELNWIMTPNFSTQYQKFYSVLEDELRKAGYKGDVDSVIQNGFWRYLVAMLSKKWKNRYDEPKFSFKERVRTYVRSQKTLTCFSRWIQRYLPQGDFLLSSLLHRRSPYYVPFKQVYEVIVGVK